MPQSFVRTPLHIVFSTKHRQPLIKPPHDTALHAYIAGICNSLDCTALKVGGYFDHVHILCLLSKKISIVALLEEVKSSSSKWMKTRDESLKEFYWQAGYGAFAVSPWQVDAVIKYIANQHEHHHKNTFEDEYRAFLQNYKMDYNEDYMWD